MVEQARSQTATAFARPSPSVRRVLLLSAEKGMPDAVRQELPSSDYAMEAFDSAEHVLARLRAQQFDVLVADFQTPGMQGAAFLKACAEAQPECMIVVVSGQVDFRVLTEMINEAGIYRFVPKRSIGYLLKGSIFEAVTARDTRLENRRLAALAREQGIVLREGTVASTDSILVIDDDAAMARAISRAIEMPGVSVQFQTDPMQALKLADESPWSCIVADYRMLDLDGARLIAAFTEKQPDCVAILISGMPNIEGLATAMGLTHIHAFMPKPWDTALFQATVKRALEQRRVRLEERALATICRERGLAA